MSYVTPITNHTASSYWNLADWTRINNNAIAVKALADTYLGVTIPRVSVSTPSAYSWPVLADLNNFIKNIDDIRAAFVTASITIPGVVILRHAYTKGPNGLSPSYIDWNKWENDLKLMYDYLTE